MNPSSIDPLALPSLSLAARSALPTCPAVYFVLEGNQVLYVGRTVNLWQRWVNHHRYSQLKGIDNARIAWLECSDSNLLPEIEAALIEHFQPSLNGELIPLAERKPPRMIVYIEPELKAAAEKLAKKQRRSVSSLVCLLLEQTVREGESPEKPTTEKPLQTA